MDITNVVLSKWYKGIKMNHVSFVEKDIIGLDTETCQGLPISFQVAAKKFNHIYFCNEENVTQKFCRFLDKNLKQGSYVFYALNLSFDLVSLLYPFKEKLLKDEFNFEYEGFNFSGIYGDLTFCHIKKHNLYITIIDISAYVRGSLAKLADIFCPDIEKLEAPIDLGKIIFNPRDAYFCKYAIRDAEICYRIGLWINALHKEFDVIQTYSVAHLASRIFRHHYMKSEMPKTTSSVMYSSLNSYHGGKNFYIDNKPNIFKNLYYIDIVSAYPYAMTFLPDFSHNTYFSTSSYKDMLGIYQIDANVKSCTYPIIYDKNFKPITGKTSKTWITGYELAEAIKFKEIKLNKIFGYTYKNINKYSPFKAFVEDFIYKKSTAINPIMRLFYKTILNSLYGKFIETREKKVSYIVNVNTNEYAEKKIIEGGSMFFPFIATLITGHTRAYLHTLEHKYKSIHSATDGLFCRVKPFKKDLGNNLGQIKLEGQGDLLAFRNKLYIFYSNQKSDLKSTIFKNKYIQNFALHGFRGNVFQLEKMWKDKKTEYQYMKMNKLKESFRRNLQVNNFEEHKASLHIDF